MRFINKLIPVVVVDDSCSLSKNDLHSLGGVGTPMDHPWRAGGARNALHIELFLSLLSSEGAFSSIVDSLAQDSFSGGKPPDPQISMVLLRDQ